MTDRSRLLDSAQKVIDEIDTLTVGVADMERVLPGWDDAPWPSMRKIVAEIAAKGLDAGQLNDIDALENAGRYDQRSAGVHENLGFCVGPRIYDEIDSQAYWDKFAMRTCGQKIVRRGTVRGSQQPMHHITIDELGVVRTSSGIALPLPQSGGSVISATVDAAFSMGRSWLAAGRCRYGD